MFKKLIVAAVVGGLAVAAVKGTKLGRAWWHDVTTAVRQAEEDIPLEKQIAMLEERHKKLSAVTLPKKIHEVAEARAEHKGLARQVAVLEESQGATQKVLAARLDAIKKGAGQVAAAASTADALVALEKDTAAWDAAQQDLAARRQTRDQAKQNVDALEEELKTLVVEIDRAGAKIQELKVKLRQVRIEQAKSNRPTDGGDLAVVKNETLEVEKRVEVEEQKQIVTNRVYGTAQAQKAAAPAVVPTIAALDARINGSPASAPATMPKAD